MNSRLLLFLLKVNKYLFQNKYRLAHIVAFTKYNSISKIINLLHSNYERLSGKTVLSSKPYLLNSELTNHCILHCLFCPTGKLNTRENGYAEYAHYEKTFNELSDYLYLATYHGWGEPLMHKSCFALINLAHSKNICSVLTTNGMLINKEIAEKLIKNKLDVLYVSIDGANEESYQKYRHGGNFKKIIDNLKVLIELKKKYNSKVPYIEWQFILFKHNEHEIKEAKGIAREIGLDSIVFLPSYTEDHSYEPSNPKFILPKHSPLLKRSHCKHLWSTLSTHWNGTVVPCCYDYEEKTPYGTLESQNILQIWNNENFQDSRKIILNGYHPDYKTLTCNECVKKIELN